MSWTDYRDALVAARQPHPHPPLLRNLDAHSAPHPGSAKPPRKPGFPVAGVLAGQHNTGIWAYAPGDPWKQRFLIDITDLLRSGEKNRIAVRGVDYGPWGGGIWKPVKLIAEK